MRCNKKFPFFIWIHYNEPHAPYLPLSPYNKLYLKDEFYNSNKKVTLVDNLEGWGGISPSANLNNIRELDYYIVQYDGEIRHVDHWVGRLINYLKKQDLYDNTLIIVTSDHGEAFGEHNLYCGHAHTLYNELLRIPLIIKFSENKYRNIVIKKQVRLIDLMPTILDWLNFNLPQYVDGESLLLLLNGESLYNPQFSFSKTGILNAIRTEKWKLIYKEKDHHELYNLEEDPYELNNVYNLNKGIATPFKIMLDKISSPTYYSEKKLLGEEDEDNEIKELLRSLGYVQ